MDALVAKKARHPAPHIDYQGREQYRYEYKIVILPADTLMLKVAIIHDRIGAQGQVIPKPEVGYEAYTVERIQSGNPIIHRARVKSDGSS